MKLVLLTALGVGGATLIGSLFGFIGMLISVPVVAVLRILFLELVKMYEEQKVKNDE